METEREAVVETSTVYLIEVGLHGTQFLGCAELFGRFMTRGVGVKLPDTASWSGSHPKSRTRTGVPDGTGFVRQHRIIGPGSGCRLCMTGLRTLNGNSSEYRPVSANNSTHTCKDLLILPVAGGKEERAVIRTCTISLHFR